MQINPVVLPYIQSSPYVARTPQIQEALQPKKSPGEIRVAHDYPIQLWSTWDVPTTMSALDQHGLGYFYQSGLLADAMGMDDSFDAVLQTRVLGLLSREIRWRPSKSPRVKAERAKLALKIIRERWEQIAPDVTLGALLRSGLTMGFQVSQILWNTDQDIWTPALQTWHPTLCWFRIDTRTYTVNAVEGQLPVIPGNGQWLLFTPHGYYRGWMQGAVRSISIPWLARQYALRDWCRYSEVHGLPVRKAKYPAQADTADKDNFFAQISNLANETSISLPQGTDKNSPGFDVELLEASADTWEAFQGLIDKCEKRMAIRMLGQNLTTDVDAGSLAAANVHDRIRLDYVRADARAMAQVIIECIFKPFCRFNFGDENLAPEFEWNCDPVEDKSQKATMVASIASALSSFALAGAPVDQRKLMEAVGIPTLDPEEKAAAPLKPVDINDADAADAVEVPDGVEVKPKVAAPGTPGAPQTPPTKDDEATARVAAKQELLAEKTLKSEPGQRFTQSIAESGQRAAREALRGHVNELLKAISGVTSFDELRQKLVDIAGDQAPGELGRLVENSMILSELAGRAAVHEER